MSKARVARATSTCDTRRIRGMQHMRWHNARMPHSTRGMQCTPGVRHHAARIHTNDTVSYGYVWRWRGTARRCSPGWGWAPARRGTLRHARATRDGLPGYLRGTELRGAHLQVQWALSAAPAGRDARDGAPREPSMEPMPERSIGEKMILCEEWFSAKNDSWRCAFACDALRVVC